MTSNRCAKCNGKIGRRGCRSEFCPAGRANNNTKKLKSVSIEQAERIKKGELILTSRGLENPPKAKSLQK